MAGIPGLGMILGPVKTLVKGGGAIARLFKGAIAVGDVSKLSKLGSISSVIGKFISAVSKWGGKLMTILGNIGKRVPFLKTIIGGIEKLINVFKGAKTKMSVPTKLSTVSTPTVSPLSTLGSSGLTSKGGSDPFGGLLSSLLGK